MASNKNKWESLSPFLNYKKLTSKLKGFGVMGDRPNISCVTRDGAQISCNRRDWASQRDVWLAIL